MAVFEAQAYVAAVRKAEVELLWSAALAADVLAFLLPATALVPAAASAA